MYLAHAAEVRAYFTEEQIELFERAPAWHHFISSGNVPLHLSRWPLQAKKNAVMALSCVPSHVFALLVSFSQRQNVLLLRSHLEQEM